MRELSDEAKYRRTRTLNNIASKKYRENKKLKMSEQVQDLEVQKERNKELEKKVEILTKKREIIKRIYSKVATKEHCAI